MAKTLRFKSKAAYRRYLQGLHARRNAGKIPPHKKGTPYPKVAIKGHPHEPVHMRGANDIAHVSVQHRRRRGLGTVSL